MTEIIKKIEKTGIFFLILCTLQPVTNFINHNINDQSFNSYRSFFYFFILFFICLILGMILNFITGRKKTIYVFFAISIIIFYTFNYGSIYLSSLVIFKQFFEITLWGTRVLLFLIPTTVLTIYFFSLFIKSQKFRIIFYSIFLTFIALDIAVLIPHYYSYIQNDKYIDFELPKLDNISEDSKSNMPNVYFILPDAMPGPHRIQETYFQNYEYESIKEFNNLGFKFINNASANGVDTYYTVPHMLSMQYFLAKSGKINESLHVELKNVFRGINPVVTEFRKRNYKYIYVDGAYGANPCSGMEDICISPNLMTNNQDRVFLQRTYIPLFFLLLEKRPFTKNILRKLKLSYDNWSLHSESEDVIFGFEKLEKNLPDISNSPYFYHLHIVLPHHPLRYDEHCNKYPMNEKNPYEKDFEIWSKGYLDQTKCAEKQILSFVKTIIKHDKNSIILIHSDTGISHEASQEFAVKRINFSDKTFDNVIGVFAAFKMPSYCYDYINEKEYSSVNAFRIIFGCIDKRKPDLLSKKIFLVDVDHTKVEGLMERNEQGKWKISEFNFEK